MVNSSGTVVWSAVYDSFGKCQVNVETVKNNLRFPGQYYDSETGLHYNWNRYYDLETGRYIRSDPLGLEGGINLYVYAMNNPLGFVDPMGLTALHNAATSQIDPSNYGSSNMVTTYANFYNGLQQPKVDIPWSEYGEGIVSYFKDVGQPPLP